MVKIELTQDEKRFGLAVGLAVYFLRTKNDFKDILLLGNNKKVFNISQYICFEFYRSDINTHIWGVICRRQSLHINYQYY